MVVLLWWCFCGGAFVVVFLWLLLLLHYAKPAVLLRVAIRHLKLLRSAIGGVPFQLSHRLCHSSSDTHATTRCVPWHHP